jgi:RNA polymerase sigma-70 factor, ECF subfamily
VNESEPIRSELISSDLISRAQAGDQAAWEALVRQHEQAAFRLAYLFLGEAAEAGDVAQEAFIRAFRALGRFDLDRPFRPWLLSITANLARNRRRSLGRYFAAVRRLVGASSDPAAAVAAAPAAAPASAQNWLAGTLWDAVRRLSSADQEVIYLRYYLGLSEAEMAAALDTAAGTVKSRLHRALARLRTLAEREFPELKEGYENG